MNNTTAPTAAEIDASLHPAEQLAMLALIPPATSGVGECESSLRTIARVRAYLDVVESEFARRLRQMHTAGQAETAAAIIAEAANTSPREAQKKERRSEILDSADAFADGLTSGAISGEHVDALANAVAGVDDDIRSKILDDQDALAKRAAHKTPAELAKELRDLVRFHQHDAGVARDTQQRNDTYLNLKLDASTGMYRINGLLHPELGTSINTAINQQVRKLIATDNTLRNEPRGRLTAEALGELITTGHTQLAAGGSVARPTAQINVLVDYDTLINQLHANGICETSDGAALPAWKVRQLACDNHILPTVLGGDSVPLDLGRSQRLFTPHQRQALRAIYSTCAMPGCDTNYDRCELHHLNPWHPDGNTDLDNAIPLCSHCHHLIHQPGWTTKLNAGPTDGRTLTITTPTGRTLVSKPNARSTPGSSSTSPPEPDPASEPPATSPTVTPPVVTPPGRRSQSPPISTTRAAEPLTLL